MGRSILALLAGFIAEPLLVIAADWVYGRIQPGAFAPGGLVVGAAAVTVLIYVQIINAISGYITGRIAQRNPVLHALILGVIGFIFASSFRRACGTFNPIGIFSAASFLPFPARRWADTWLAGNR